LETEIASKNGANGSSSRYSFGEFEVDAAERTCLRSGETVPLTGKVFDVLLAFVESPNRLLTKDDLMERVWRDEFVEEGNLARNISTLRKALGDNNREHKIIATVQGRGYRFLPEVSKRSDDDPDVDPTAAAAIATASAEIRSGRSVDKTPVRWILLTVMGLTLVTAAWFGSARLLRPVAQIKTLAVLPLRGIDPNDNYLGIGIADAVIRRISSSGQMIVRPTSAVLHYLERDTDSLAAARELNADAILEGNVQRSGDTLRVSVNLLRTADGISIWNESFDLRTEDIFRVQDEVATRVADKLKIRLNAADLSNTDKYPVDQRAYEYYLKGMFALDAKGFDRDSMPQMLNTISLFQQAIEIDPNYAMAHGELANSYAWMALFGQPEEPKWVDLARSEIAAAEKLDPNVAESHIASGLLAWSVYGGHDSENAIKEFRLAKQLNPSYAGADLIALYGHVGLDEQAAKELNRGLSIDPTSRTLNGLSLILPRLRGDADAWFAEWQKNNSGSRPVADVWYLLRKGRLEDAKKVLDFKDPRDDPNDPHEMSFQALYLAQAGKFQEAEALVPLFLAKLNPKDESFHHMTYNAACVYALDANAAEAVKRLRETANTGYPNYPLFAADHYLDRIRQSPEFIQFLAEQKTQWERFEQEFTDQ
jgi:DNA-binding winged helix-turn-helix (wHTH) protein/TolB-like protein